MTHLSVHQQVLKERSRDDRGRTNRSNFILAAVLFPSLAFVMILCFAGCGGPARPGDLPTLHPCSITVSQDGVPLVNATVKLYSTDPDFKWAVIGQSDVRGKATLSTHAQFPGAPQGEYKVVVLKAEEVYKGNSVDIFTLIDKQYTDPETTPLSITIGKGNNTQQFDLGRSLREKLKAIAL